MDVVLVLVVVAAVAWLVIGPLRPGRAVVSEAEESAEHAELEALKEAKYREIRDAELDHRTGKLSEADWRALDRQLRGEAIDLLRRLDAFDSQLSNQQRGTALTQSDAPEPPPEEPTQ